jgi:hypothetical protein
MNPYDVPSLALDQGPAWKTTRARVHAEHAARLSAASSPPQQAESVPMLVAQLGKDRNAPLLAVDEAETTGARSVKPLVRLRYRWVRAPD